MTDCPSCGRPLPGDVRFCPACGSPAPPAPAEEPTLGGADQPTVALEGGADAAPTQLMAPPASLWACPRCGAEQPVQDRFCASCGAPYPDDAGEAATSALPRVPTCAACGAALEAGTQFCPACGARRGDIETADSREATVVAPVAAPPVYVPADATPPPPPPPPQPPPLPAPPAASHRRRNAIVAVVALVILAAGGFCAWWFLLRDTEGAARDDFIAQASPVLQPVAAAQNDAEAALKALDAADAATFAAAKAAGARLAQAVASATGSADQMQVKKDALPLLAKLKSALSAHAPVAEAIGGLPEDPAQFTAEQAEQVSSRATSAASAYDQLDQAAPGLPATAFAEATGGHLADVAAAVADDLKQQQAQRDFLLQLSALFERSRAERENAEQILAQFEAVELPPDNANGRMKAAAANLKSVLTQIDAVAPPEGQAARALQSQYHEAVQHWASAAELYAKWMWTAHEYYQAGGWYPDPEQGHEADLYLDPSYDSARKEQDLADTTRAAFAEAFNARSAEFGLPADYDSTAM